MEDSDSASLSSPSVKGQKMSQFKQRRGARFSSCHLAPPSRRQDDKAKVSALIDYNVLQGDANLLDKVIFNLCTCKKSNL